MNHITLRILHVGSIDGTTPILLPKLESCSISQYHYLTSIGQNGIGKDSCDVDLNVVVNAYDLILPNVIGILLGRAQPVIPPNLYVNEHNSLGSPGNWY